MKTFSITINYKWNSKQFPFSFKLFDGSREDIFIEYFNDKIFHFIMDCLKRDIERNIQLYSIHGLNNLSIDIRDWIETSLLKSIELFEFFDDISYEVLDFCFEDYHWLIPENPTIMNLSVLETLAESTFHKFGCSYRIYEKYPNTYKLPLSVSVSNIMAWKWISYLYKNSNQKNTALKAKINDLVDLRNYRDARVIIQPNNYQSISNQPKTVQLSKYKNLQREILKNFIEIVGIIPSQKDMNMIHLFYPQIFKNLLTKKIPAKHFEDLLNLESPDWFISEEGSWFEALIKCGCLENAERKSKYGTWNISKDGHTCKSIAEKNVDDWLYENGIQHEKEVRYPNSNYIADWKVNDHFIELYGLKGLSDYDAKIIDKRKYADEGGFKIIELFLKDVIDLDNKLNILKT
jgi:hypothetical protein